MIKKNYKTLILFSLFISFIFVSFIINISSCFPSNYVRCDSNGIIDFDDLEDDDIYDFFVENQISISSIFNDNDDAIAFAIMINDNLLDDINYSPMFNCYEKNVFANEIIDALLENCEISLNRSLDENELEDSLVYNSVDGWVSSGGDFHEYWENFNCYAYAINRFELDNYYNANKYNPGVFAQNSYYYGISLNDFCDLVIDDLESIGMSNVSCYSYIPVSLTENQRLIALRLSTYDYHFMKYNNDDETWYHKPSITAILKYKYVPSNNRVWTNECSKYGAIYNPNIIYNSDIRFIVYTIPEYNMNCRSDTINTIITPNVGNDYMIEVDFDCDHEYKISAFSNSGVSIKVYDELMDSYIGSTTTQNNGCYVSVNLDIAKGRYYVLLYFNNHQYNGSINLSIEVYDLNTTYEAFIGSYPDGNDLLEHLHYELNNGYHNYFYFEYIWSFPGFYNVEIVGSSSSQVSYSQGAITIYSDSSKTTYASKFNNNYYANYAISDANNPSFVMYMIPNMTYYIDINLNTDQFNYLYLDIYELDLEEIDLFNLNAIQDSDAYYESCYQGDTFKRLYLAQNGKFNISVESNERDPVDSLFVFLKIEYSQNLQAYIITNLHVVDLVNVPNQEYDFDVILSPGSYYIGVFNISDNRGVILEVKRKLTISGSSSLITDPGPGWNCGSQINFVEKYESVKSYQGTNIGVGFTRLIYINNSLVPSNSRLDYYWFSSDDDKASVTNYGTVLGKNIGTVKIMAVLKSDPSVAFVKEFTINNAVINFDITDTISIHYNQTNNGTFRLPLENVNCPYPLYQFYDFEIIEESANINASIDGYCYFTVSNTGYFLLLINSYVYNEIVRLFLTVNII